MTLELIVHANLKHVRPDGGIGESCFWIQFLGLMVFVRRVFP